MIDFAYLERGITGLAHAYKAGTMAGHLGAAVAAGYFYGEDQTELPEAVYRGVEGELDRVIAGEEAIWWNVKQTGITPSELFEPLAAGEEARGEVGTILEALRGNVGETRQSGHNVIFASIAIRGLQDHPRFATTSVVEGIRKLVAGFDGANAGRGYYGKEKGWLNGNQVVLGEDEGFKPYGTIEEMVSTTIDELIATASVKKQGFGGLWHVINHAAGIAQLAAFGHDQVAREALAAHHHHVRLWRSLPDVEEELGPVVKAEHDPREPIYWEGMLKRDEARLTHRIKTLYGFNVLKGFVEDDGKRSRAEEAFLYLMA